MGVISCLLFALLLLLPLAHPSNTNNNNNIAPQYDIGTGIYDVTGPAGQIIMMGYANLGQDTRGIHTRLHSRAYIFVDKNNGNRVVFASIDIAFGTQIIKNKVMKKLSAQFGDLYTPENVALSGTHTHSGPGGYTEYVLFNIPSVGYCAENVEIIADGIFQSIAIAHKNIRPSYGYLNAGDLFGANINRSPFSYEQNPEEERAQYPDNTDTLMTLLKIVDQDGLETGALNWFAVHPVSMNNTNHLISSDHKGAASLLFEAEKNGIETPPGSGDFVAAFASSNLGDVSPATKGTFCTGGRRPGLKCDYETSTCPNWLGNPSSKLCHGQGPAGKDSKFNTKAIADLQYEKAKELYDSATIPLAGDIQYRHIYVDMPNLYVQLGEEKVKLCKAAMGYSFAAGTTDGPGMFLFSQGDTTGNEFWDMLRDFLKEPSQEIIDCQAPKPILLPTGEMKFPHDWQPDIIDLQLFKIGNLVIIICPGELTTMAGRRVRNAIKQILVDGGVIPNDAFVVIAGLANTYSDYYTTFEEYQVQRYEAASTIFGPNSLNGLIQEYSRLAQSIVSNGTLEPGPTPPDLEDKLIGLIPLPKQDTVPEGQTFGGIITDVKESYLIGEVVEASFWAGNPRNDFQLGKSFLYVDRSNGTLWTPIRTDATWDTEFHWEQTTGRLEPSESVATLKWFTDSNSIPAQYRLRYEGHYKDEQDNIIAFTGVSSTFTLLNKFQHKKVEHGSAKNTSPKPVEGDSSHH